MTYWSLYAISAFVVAALCGWAGYQHGVDVERGRAAVEATTAIVAAADAARRDADAESARRAEAAIRDARRAAASREIKLKGQIHALQSARPECALPEPRRLLINAAVDAANSAAEPAANGMPAALPPAAAPR